MKAIHTISTLISLALFAGIIALAFIGGNLELISEETFLTLAKPMGVVCFHTTFVSYIFNHIK
ncbi:hypothetical protein SIPHO016v1_p0010 [Vibrio phage 38E33.6a]|nr:hypothetical protein SIPHO018v1_90001 [Vibrio phage 11E33.1]QZI92538.1 hypothetical protein SIPHO017v1_p0005 [Vibrio phage 19E33.1]QZI92789.1 hypothetical protein SIPHO016v1_p0010 [Vibrio phage 38E33.6a]QZI92977.1 hypothetical protein SIPHO015v1_p0039 [Vibrio phage 82E32.2]QZI93004.1 hypothetical protein SIPHO014v1_p0005 [Vibrio phage 82E32.3]QZI93113.1 hypothetical protein SIPHO013v1_p0052 [Vibrio phage 82E33.2]